MSKLLSFKGASEMPMISVSFGNMEWNKTGAWRAQRPFYEDKTPPCSAACPAGNDIVAFIQKITEGDFEGAWSLIKEENPFPGICGRVCFHPCESKCNRGAYDEPVAIHALERFVSDYASTLNKKTERVPGARKGKVAVIGSGPAGMGCAYHLAKLHYEVTVFESSPSAGGMLRMGIPSYRLPKGVLDREISTIQALGVEIRTGIPFGEKLGLDDLKDYQATFIATGAHRGRGLNIPGEKGKSVFNGLDLLRKINVGHRGKLGDKVSIIGGGNTAIDVARSVIRLGKKATILYRRSKEEMPAFEDEILEAIEEGVKIRYLVNPVRIQQKDDMKRLECLRMELGEKDESGRRKPVAVPDSNFFIEADTVIVAAGEEIEVSFLPKGIEKKDGIVLTQRDGNAGVKGIFAGGDLTSNQRTVAHAIGSGKKAALAIDCYLQGKNAEEAIGQILIGEGPSLSIFRHLHPEERPMNPHVVAFEELNTDYFETSKRHREQRGLARKRIKGFEEVTSTLTEKIALKEAERCFSCGTCNGCENCYVFCPDASIVKVEEILSRQVDYDFCKGCGICFSECPRGAISLKEEAR
ncbi:MAG: iron-sulfur-binding oxidoreductase, related to glutamate synthase small chain GltD [Deltaproteobacteria bacterium]|nr:iron-sulfur-binding oxidoreductase, related to glutamate synthase small chain GltD [Deltaproteobacteria bacterium]